MPFVYCSQCDQPIPDWREALSGCHHCGEKYYEIDDVGARMVIDHLIDEIDELKESKKRLDKLEEWVWEHVKYVNCSHYQQVDYQGELCNAFSDNHYCDHDKCPQFLK